MRPQNTESTSTETPEQLEDKDVASERIQIDANAEPIPAPKARQSETPRSTKTIHIPKIPQRISNSDL